MQQELKAFIARSTPVEFNGKIKLTPGLCAITMHHRECLSAIRAIIAGQEQCLPEDLEPILFLHPSVTRSCVILCVRGFS